MTGPSPVDRGKSGSKLHVLCDRAGITLVRSHFGGQYQRRRIAAPAIGSHPGGAGRAGGDRRSCTPTRHTTTPNYADGSEVGESASGSPAKASNPATDSDATGGSSNARSPGWPLWRVKLSGRVARFTLRAHRARKEPVCGEVTAVEDPARGQGASRVVGAVRRNERRGGSAAARGEHGIGREVEAGVPWRPGRRRWTRCRPVRPGRRARRSSGGCGWRTSS